MLCFNERRIYFVLMKGGRKRSNADSSILYPISSIKRRVNTWPQIQFKDSSRIPSVHILYYLLAKKTPKTKTITTTTKTKL